MFWLVWSEPAGFQGEKSQKLYDSLQSNLIPAGNMDTAGSE